MSEDEFSARKRELELAIMEKQLYLKDLEIKKAEKENAFTGGFKLTPVTTTILVAVLGLTGTLLANFLQRQTAMEVERQKTLFAIYSKAQESPDPETAARILDFYIAMKIIEGEKGQFMKAIEANDESDSVPPVFTPAGRTVEGVYSPEARTIPPKNADGSWEIKGSFLTGDGVSHTLSPNTSGEFKEGFPDAIIIHTTFGVSLERSVEWLTKPDTKAGSHFIIGKSGEVIQMIPLNYTTWHAGMSEFDGRTSWNNFSIGIELDNVGYLERAGKDYITAFGFRIPADRVVEKTHKHEKVARYWEIYTPEQIAAAEKLCKLLTQKFQVRYIVGHEDVSKGRKLEPGPAFPMERLQKLVKQK